MAKNNRQIKKAIKKASFDTLTNLITGMGTRRDSRSYSQFRHSMMTDYYELEAAYVDHWLAAAIVDNPIEDAIREWRSFNFDESETLIDAEKTFKVQETLKEALTWSGVYGGAGIIPIFDNQPLDSELDIKSIKKGSLKRFLVLDRTYLVGQDMQLDSPMSANFALPEHYVVGGGTRIHHSRVIRVDGEKLPMRLRSMNNGWGDSQLRKCIDDVKDAITAKGGIANLISKANIDTITKDNLTDDLSDADTSHRLMERYHLFGLMESMFRLALLDGTETLDRKQVSFGGLGETLGYLMEWTAGAAKQPMTRLFGIQSKGLGDSGTGDMRTYHSRIKGAQESKHRPILTAMDEIIFMSELGRMPEEYGFEFNPLTQLTDEEISVQRLADAQTDDIRLNQGVIKRSQIAKKLQEQAVYAITDNDIKDLEADEGAEREGDYQFKLANAVGNVKESAEKKTNPAGTLQ